MKKLFSSLTKFERILLLFSLIVITAAFIIFDGKDYISFIASITTIESRNFWISTANLWFANKFQKEICRFLLQWYSCKKQITAFCPCWFISSEKACSPFRHSIIIIILYNISQPFSISLRKKVYFNTKERANINKF